VRAVIYTSGDVEVRRRQLAACIAHAERLGVDVAAITQDGPDGARDGWIAAQQAVASGQADRIIVSEPAAVPDWIELACDADPVRRPRRIRVHLAGLHRRGEVSG
jgi:hypothetical protein